MHSHRGFSLIEVIVVVVILGVIATLSVPTYLSFMQQASAKSTQDNLVVIQGAELNYYLTKNKYCTGACGNLPTINSNLSLTITDNYFNYSCENIPVLTCTAKNKTDATFKLSVTNKPLILPGGTGCATSTGASCNPSCSYPKHPNYCPS